MPFGIVEVIPHGLVYLLKKRPYPNLASTGSTKIERSIGIGKAKILICAGIVSLGTGEVNDIRRVNHLNTRIENLVKVPGAYRIFQIFLREGGDAGLVGMSRDVAVGNTNGYPNSSLIGIVGFLCFLVNLQVSPLSNHFKNPYLIFISHRERFPLAVVPVLLHQLCHNLDGFTSALGTLQGNVHQRSIVD